MQFRMNPLKATLVAAALVLSATATLAAGPKIFVIGGKADDPSVPRQKGS